MKKLLFEHYQCACYLYTHRTFNICPKVFTILGRYCNLEICNIEVESKFEAGRSRDRDSKFAYENTHHSVFGRIRILSVELIKGREMTVVKMIQSEVDDGV